MWGNMGMEMPADDLRLKRISVNPRNKHLSPKTFKVVRTLPDGRAEIEYSNGQRRRTQLFHCVECHFQVPYEDLAKNDEETYRRNISGDIQHDPVRYPYCIDCQRELAEEAFQQQRIKHKEFLQAHRQQFLAEYAKKRAFAMSIATPLWADRKAIAEIYRACREKSQSTGVVYHVDHIVPIQGRKVSGLHVHWNLRIITASENCAKGNRLTDAA